MTTYVYTGSVIETRNAPSAAEAMRSFDPAAQLEVVVFEGVTTFQYGLAASGDTNVAEMELDVISIRHSGTLGTSAPERIRFFTVSWTGDAQTHTSTLVQAAFALNETTDIEYTFWLAGDPLPDLSTLPDFDAFRDAWDPRAINVPANAWAPGRTIELAAPPNTTRTENDRIDMLGVSGNSVSSGRGNDTIVGTDASETLNAGDGADQIAGGGGDDEVSAGDGPDTIFGGAGHDSLWGGDGRDLLGGGDGADVIDGGEERDTLWGGADHDTLSGGAGADQIGGGTGDDHIDGGTGNDSLWGAIGNDTILGGAGADEIWGADGDNRLEGGEGNDALGGKGHDTINGGAGRDTIYAAAGDDFVDGGPDDDIVFGGAGQDRLSGWTGNDQLYGYTENDYIDGGAGNDTIYAGTGDDTVTGGLGDDQIFLAAGADVFIFSTGSDTVGGFDTDEGDILDLTAANQISSLSDFSRNHTTETDQGLLVLDGYGNSTLLLGVELADFSNVDLIFSI